MPVLFLYVEHVLCWYVLPMTIVTQYWPTLIMNRAGNKRRLTKSTLFKRYVYGTVRLNRPNKGVNFGRSESSKDGRPFLDVQASTATEMARPVVKWTNLLFLYI